MKIKTRCIILSLVVVILLLVTGILFAIDTFTLKQQFSKSTAVFSGKAVRPTYTVPPMGIAPSLSATDLVARATTMTGIPLSVLNNYYRFTLTPAMPYNGNRGNLCFVNVEMVITRPDYPSCMLNTGQTIWLDLYNIPSSAGKVLEVDLNVRSAWNTTITVEGMGSTQTFYLTRGTPQRLTLLTLLPVSFNNAFWSIRGTGDSWYFYGADIFTIN